MFAKKNDPPKGAAEKGNLIEFVVEDATYTGTVIGVYTNSVSVEVEAGQKVIRNKESFQRTVVGHSEYKVLPQ